MQRRYKPFSYSFFSFVRHNVNGGIILMIMAVLAIIVANSPWSSYYLSFLNHPLSLMLGEFNLLSHHGEPLTVSEFINDCLMAVFFFHVGLEIKKELLVGELSSVRKASLPILAATGGMIFPVLVYAIIDHSELGLRGGAIPMATDIAFSLGVLSLLGKNVPLGLRIFLTAFAVVDDIGGILVIALLYTEQLYWGYLLAALVIVVGLFIANRLKVQTKALYIFAGILVWYLFLQSGIHSTIAGVLAAFTIPARPKLKIQKYIKRIQNGINRFPRLERESIVLTNEQICELENIRKFSGKVVSPLQYMEEKLGGLVNYFILPLFAFANAGIVFTGGGELFGMVACAVALGLIIGKPIGLFGFTWLFTKLKVVSLPAGVNWKSILGVSFLGGDRFYCIIIYCQSFVWDSCSRITESS